MAGNNDTRDRSKFEAALVDLRNFAIRVRNEDTSARGIDFERDIRRFDDNALALLSRLPESSLESAPHQAADREHENQDNSGIVHQDILSKQADGFDTATTMIRMRRGTMNVLDMLQSPEAHISKFQEMAVGDKVCSGLKKIPEDYQWNAVQYIEYNAKTNLKASCIVDPSGLGKILPAMIVTVNAKRMTGQASLIIALPRVTVQWAEEFSNSFEEGYCSCASTH